MARSADLDLSEQEADAIKREAGDDEEEDVDQAQGDEGHPAETLPGLARAARAAAAAHGLERRGSIVSSAVCPPQACVPACVLVAPGQQKV
eukprot:scaffold74023_cov75-Phaeocystis_antarctica.AAC.2